MKNSGSNSGPSPALIRRVEADGALTFDFAPRILDYLRTKGDTSESEASQRLRVVDVPLKPEARIRFDPKQGLEINTGYPVDGEPDRMVSLEDFDTTADGNYVLAGDTFRPIERGVNDKVKAWLQQPFRRLSLDQIPEFFLRDLVLIKKEFNAVLIDDAEKIRILADVVTPVVRVEIKQPGWLDFKIEYDHQGIFLPDGLLPRATGKPFIQLDDFDLAQGRPGGGRKNAAVR